MGRTTRIAGAVLVGVGLAACSRTGTPAPQSASAAESGAARDLRLPDAPEQGGAVASDLEAGRPVSQVATVARRMVPAPHPAQPAEAAPSAAVTGVAVSTAQATPVLEPVAIPESHTIYLAPTGPLEAATPVNLVAGTSLGGSPHIGESYGGSRGPSIIIRGGMGGIDDKCDLRPRGFGGTAINRVIPPIGGRGGRPGIR